MREIQREINAVRQGLEFARERPSRVFPKGNDLKMRPAIAKSLRMARKMMPDDFRAKHAILRNVVCDAVAEAALEKITMRNILRATPH